MKKLFTTMIFLSILTVLFSGCHFSTNLKFGELEIGKNFMSSRDGYYKNLPHNYCLNVHLRSKVQLFRVPSENSDLVWDSSIYDDCTILEGHFIKGFFTTHYLALCEEKNDGNLLYLTFDFSNEQVQFHQEISDICQLLDVNSFQWFTLCNTNQEIQKIK